MKRYEMANVDRKEFAGANIEFCARVYGESRPDYYRAEKVKYSPRYGEKYYTKARKAARADKQARRYEQWQRL